MNNPEKLAQWLAQVNESEKSWLPKEICYINHNIEKHHPITLKLLQMIAESEDDWVNAYSNIAKWLDTELKTYDFQNKLKSLVGE